MFEDELMDVSSDPIMDPEVDEFETAQGEVIIDNGDVDIIAGIDERDCCSDPENDELDDFIDETEEDDLVHYDGDAEDSLVDIAEEIEDEYLDSVTDDDVDNEDEIEIKRHLDYINNLDDDDEEDEDDDEFVEYED